MKNIEEQISEMIWHFSTGTPVRNMTKYDKHKFKVFSLEILGTVLIEIECPECGGSAICDQDQFCKGTGKIAIALKELVRRTKK